MHHIAKISLTATLMCIQQWHKEGVTKRCSVIIGFLEITNFTGKHLCQSLFFNKVLGLRPGEDRILAIRGVLRNFAKFLGKH